MDKQIRKASAEGNQGESAEQREQIGVDVRLSAYGAYREWGSILRGAFGAATMDVSIDRPKEPCTIYTT